MRTLWGVDSAVQVTDELYRCVTRNFGIPKFWGRYLTRVPNVNDGLTKEEIASIHRKGAKVLPIYNAFRQATGYREGTVAASNTIYNLQLLGFPTGTFAFGNIEHFFEVDEAWIRGWVDRFYTSGYRPGLYHDPVRGEFHAAYCQAVANHPRVGDQLVLWSAEPEPGASKEKDAPKYNPAKPNCKANVWLWQYGRDAQDCPIDTNLMDPKLFNNLW